MPVTTPPNRYSVPQVLCALAASVLVGCGGAQAPADEAVFERTDKRVPARQPGDGDTGDDHADTNVDEDTGNGSELGATELEVGGGNDGNEPAPDDGEVVERAVPTDAPAPGPVAPEPPPQPASLSRDAETGSGGSGSPGWAHKRALRRARRAVEEIRSLRGTMADASCGQACELAGAICASRDVICEVSQQYRDARGDCEWAEQACTDADGQCRSCRGETAGGAP